MSHVICHSRDKPSKKFQDILLILTLNNYVLDNCEKQKI